MRQIEEKKTLHLEFSRGQRWKYKKPTIESLNLNLGDSACLVEKFLQKYSECYTQRKTIKK